MLINFKQESGFTLVEVLIAIVILLIIVISFTTLFTSSFSGIASSGHRSETLFEIQQNIESDIHGGSAGSQGNLDIEFNNDVTIPGEHKTFTRTTSDGKEVVVDVFVREE